MSEPIKWTVRQYADIGTSEEFVRQFLELPEILNAGELVGPEREQAKEAITTVLMDGLIPAFSEIKQIRASVGQDLPELNRLQLYEDFARKLWKAYKDLMQRAGTSLGFDFGFLFRKDSQFESGLKKFFEQNPTENDVFEKSLRQTRNGWQKELYAFRNEYLEHQSGDRRKYAKFYEPKTAEVLFLQVWRTIVDILAVLLSLHLPEFVTLVDNGSNDPGRKEPKRFGFRLTGVKLP